ncbi:MAG: porin family protein [Bacteroidales bacterium]|nr:porin family protein [Bacteroidales bacterium]
MKKSFLLLLTLFFCISVSNAQFTKLGGGLGFTSGYLFHEMDYDYNQSGHFNFYANGIYELTLPIHIAPSVTYFFPHVWKSGTQFDESKITVTTLMFDINGHYVFNSLDKFEFYGLAGLNVLLAWKKDVLTITGTAPSTQTTKESDTAIGLNLGAGTYFKLTEEMDLNLEVKYLVSRYNQFMVNAGVLINFQFLAQNEKAVK